MARKKHKAPPPWLVVGARVDYCSIIGRPPTERDRVVRANPEQLASGAWVVWLDGKSGCVSVDACMPADSLSGGES